MTNINIDLATKLDGSETHMLAILVDSWGDKLIVPLNCEMAIEPADYFTPCPNCGNAVLNNSIDIHTKKCDHCKIQPRVIDKCGYCNQAITEGTYYVRIDNILYHEQCNTVRKNAILDMALTQTLPEDTMKTKKTPMNTVNVSNRIVVNESLDMEERIAIAAEAACETFWEIVSTSFPESVSGDFLMSDMEDVMLSWVKHWVDNNVPAKQSYRGDSLTELTLHYDDMWHMPINGYVLSDNVVVDGKHVYIGVSSENVCIYIDTFNQDDFMQEHIASWAFGDNPTVLMNMIDIYLGGPVLWNTCELFDDIMTIGKSKLV